MAGEKVALVTGGSRGIGNAIAVKLAEEGFAVAIVASSDEALSREGISKIKKALDGRSFKYIKADIASHTDRKMILKEVVSDFGRLDVLVNNAGVAPFKRMDILETTVESFDRVIGINLKGTFFMSQLAANEMIRQSEQQKVIRSRMIINISSVSAYTASYDRGEYCISKAGISMVTALFADRLARYGINVYEIRPGIIQTDMTEGVKGKYDALIDEGITPIRRWGYPEDVAEAAAVICSGKLSFSTGEIINVDGGFHIRRL
ncbi:MAG: 3-ketoacyl-ACP reductase [Eubacteriales bacterium]|nr:3-ketoacyl-ACP reductase [Eubacteriales bacterium]